LWSIFQGYGRAEKGHDPIAGHLIHCAFVIMDFVDQDFVDLIHDGVSFLRTEALGELSESLHIAEHYCDLFPFAFYSVSL